ncbi:hypothetical protein LOC71_22200 [Rhodopirellula sp. JC740]|uniref:Uncharacterized protein n=1 Tax=Rhodopirellula halodulae TaxID=2894198 RepID=A0ABS8NQ92_9BACT|nr:hypothetical protein [Rhodopirellula sp. JC740]MCC9644998.1 hypothetical protein [Rhodopirellula sp. JC740]
MNLSNVCRNLLRLADSIVNKAEWDVTNLPESQCLFVFDRRPNASAETLRDVASQFGQILAFETAASEWVDGQMVLGCLIQITERHGGTSDSVRRSYASATSADYEPSHDKRPINSKS